jgi:hypothetical protein
LLATALLSWAKIVQCVASSFKLCEKKIDILLQQNRRPQTSHNGQRTRRKIASHKGSMYNLSTKQKDNIEGLEGK